MKTKDATRRAIGTRRWLFLGALCVLVVSGVVAAGLAWSGRTDAAIGVFLLTQPIAIAAALWMIFRLSNRSATATRNLTRVMRAESEQADLARGAELDALAERLAARGTDESARIRRELKALVRQQNQRVRTEISARLAAVQSQLDRGAEALERAEVRDQEAAARSKAEFMRTRMDLKTVVRDNSGKHAATADEAKKAALSALAAHDRAGREQDRVKRIPTELTPAQEMSVVGWPRPRHGDKPVVMAVLDEFSTDSFGPDARLILPRPDNWSGLAQRDAPELVMVESAWKGNGGGWQYRVGSYTYSPGPELSQLMAWAKTNDIPTVFWNKEDPVHHTKFMAAAKLADHVFTTDQNKVASYRRQVGHDFVHSLPFAAQPQLHKPRPLAGRSDRVAFAGSWYGNRHAERGEAMRWLLSTGRQFGLDIFDRNHGSGLFPFPDELADSVVGSLDYRELSRRYGTYRAFLNVNSVSDSPTMFSRRVFELLASGTPVISTPARGITELLGEDAVWIVESEDEASIAMQTLLTDDQEWRRRSLAGIRRVFADHTYADRLRKVFDITGVAHHIHRPDVLLIARATTSGQLDKLAQATARQSYPGLSMIAEVSPDLLGSSPSRPGVTMVAPGVLDPLVAAEIAEGDRLVGWLSPRHEYGSNYVLDLVNATRHRPEAAGWGKAMGSDTFDFGAPTMLSATLWRPSVFAEHWLHSTDVLVDAPGLFVIDTDEFAAEGADHG